MNTKNWVPDLGHPILNTQNWVPNLGYSIRGTQFGVLRFGYQILGTQLWVPQIGSLTPIELTRFGRVLGPFLLGHCLFVFLGGGPFCWGHFFRPFWGVICSSIEDRADSFWSSIGSFTPTEQSLGTPDIGYANLGTQLLCTKFGHPECGYPKFGLMLARRGAWLKVQTVQDKGCSHNMIVF